LKMAKTEKSTDMSNNNSEKLKALKADHGQD
jgi:hypothetical protein